RPGQVLDGGAVLDHEIDVDGGLTLTDLDRNTTGDRTGLRLFRNGVPYGADGTRGTAAHGVNATDLTCRHSRDLGDDPVRDAGVATFTGALVCASGLTSAGYLALGLDIRHWLPLDSAKTRNSPCGAGWSVLVEGLFGLVGRGFGVLPRLVPDLFGLLLGPTLGLIELALDLLAAVVGGFAEDFLALADGIVEVLAHALPPCPGDMPRNPRTEIRHSCRRAVRMISPSAHHIRTLCSRQGTRRETSQVRVGNAVTNPAPNLPGEPTKEEKSRGTRK